MINLLPPELKEQRKYGRLNILMTKQLVGIFLIGALACAIMLSGLSITAADEEFLDSSIEIKESLYAEIQPFEQEANKLKADIKKIEQVYDREVQLSKLIVEIASSIPVGAQLSGLALTGGDTSPLQVSAITDSQNKAAVLRKNLVDSGVFESADIESITKAEAEDGEITYAVAIQASLTGSAEKIAQQKAAEAAKAEAAAAAAEESGESE